MPPPDPTKPLLKLNAPGAGDRRRGARANIPFPSPVDRQAQAQRLGPRFRQLREAQDTLVLRGDPTALAPETLVVFELTGQLITFARAVERLPGLQIVAEELVELLDEESGELEKSFYYLAIPNAEALRQLLRLWDLWQAGRPIGDEHKNWEQVFSSLKDLRRWGPKDRLSEFARQRIADDAAFGDPVVVELELIFAGRRQDEVRGAAIEAVARAGGEILDRATIPQIAYDALLIELPPATALAIAELQPGTLADSADVFAIRPQSVPAIEPTQDDEVAEGVRYPAPAGAPLVALLDAVPLTGHPRLAGRVDFDDPDDLSESAVGQRRHGTAMASLVVWGPLEAAEAPLPRPVLFRPLMYSNDFDVETFPPRRLIVDQFVRAVRGIKEGEEASGRSVLFINVSLGDENRPFDSAISPWARALDWLSNEYGVVFIVSAGNAASLPCINPADDAAMTALTGDQRTKVLLGALRDDMRNRRIIAPAESANAITVGALHRDTLGTAPSVGASHDPYPTGALPSAVSRLGPGFSKSIKPDVLAPAGRLRATFAQMGGTKLVFNGANRFGGLKVAGPREDLDAWSGATSAAAALVTRGAHLVHDAITEAYGEVFTALPPIQQALIVKALLVHRAKVPDDGRSLVEEVFGPAEPRLSAQRRANILRLFGYGAVEIDEVRACVANRATLWGSSTVGENATRTFLLPLPQAIFGNRTPRSISCTIAWLSPSLPGRRSYKAVRLEVEEPEDLKRVGVTPIAGQADRKSAARGTVFHRGWDGTTLRQFVDGSNLVLSVCRKPDPADDLPDAVPFGIAVTVESSNDEAQVYEQVRARIDVQPRVRAPAAVRVPG